MSTREAYRKSATVPGRVNLIGEWIDFNGGTVLPMAIEQTIQLGIQANRLECDRVASQQFSDQRAFPLDAPASGHWSDYVRGGLKYARARGWLEGGQDVMVTSRIPVGAGLSSSAATIVATLKAAAPPEERVDARGIAVAAREIENEFMGVPCGIMDQMAVSIGMPGHVLALDTRDLTFEILTVPEDWAVAVVHSGIDRALSDGRYRTRQEECRKAADILKVEYLCQADFSSVSQLGSGLKSRALHVISEGQRSLRAVEALRSGDRAQFGQLMNESHTSLRDDMDVSVEPIDQMVADAVALGADGARITGAGFGGCFVCLISPEKLYRWSEDLKTRHPSVRLIT